jgi:hypothetical protein
MSFRDALSRGFYQNILEGYEIRISNLEKMFKVEWILKSQPRQLIFKQVWLQIVYIVKLYE